MANIRVRLETPRAEGPPARRLIVGCEFENRSDHAATVLSCWTQASFTPGGVVAEGSLLCPEYPVDREATVRPGESSRGRFVVPITPQAIDAVEQERMDGVNLELRCRLLAVTKDSTEHVDCLSALCEIGLQDVRGLMPAVSISRSEWIQFLRQWRWSEIELFELPFDVHRESPAFQRAFGLLRTAEERLHNGDYAGTFQNCRQALESLAKDTVPEKGIKDGFTQLLETRLQGEEK